MNPTLNSNTKFLGIDYGIKNIGVAVSDETCKLAFPKYVLKNDDFLFKHLIRVISEENISAIVVGESIDYKGKDNVIMKNIRRFKKMLEERLTIPVYFEPEFLTSIESKHLQLVENKIDASAAALILQSYLDKERNNK